MEQVVNSCAPLRSSVSGLANRAPLQATSAGRMIRRPLEYSIGRGRNLDFADRGWHDASAPARFQLPTPPFCITATLQSATSRFFQHLALSALRLHP